MAFETLPNFVSCKLADLASVYRSNQLVELAEIASLLQKVARAAELKSIRDQIIPRVCLSMVPPLFLILPNLSYERNDLEILMNLFSTTYNWKTLGTTKESTVMVSKENHMSAIEAGNLGEIVNADLYEMCDANIQSKLRLAAGQMGLWRIAWKLLSKQMN